ncbi:MAG TPA: thioesterase family protein [Stellaceae bacterium]|nr:thioesterase family protein [Stellaceae bacterium]
MTEPFVHSRPYTIEWGDCDPAGIVWNPRFFGLFDGATVALFTAALGMKKAEMLKTYGSAGYPLVETRAVFHAPCRFGDEVRIDSMVTAFRRSSFDITHRLFLGDTLAVEGFETRVWVGRDPADPERIRARPIPTDVIERFSRAK